MLLQTHLPVTELRVAADRRQRAGQGVSQRRYAPLITGCQQAQLLQQPQGSAPLGQGGDEVDDGIDNAPGDVAADAGDQQIPDLGASRLERIEATGEGEHHQQAEQDLRVAGDGIYGGKTG